VTRTLYTVAFPGLSAADRRQIDTLRDRHDASNARIIPPHFTLVFACALSVGSLQENGFGIHATYPGFREFRPKP